jgi:outer membrane protein TolC
VQIFGIGIYSGLLREKYKLGWRALVVSLAMAISAPAVIAQTYEQSLQAARAADAQYSAQLASVSGRRVQSNQAGSAFYPQASVYFNQADVAVSGRSTRNVVLTQPIFSYDRYLTLQQADPLAALAEADLGQANNDLALRVFTAMAEIVRNREQIRALGVQINGLEEQLRRATRMRELGQGTITDVSDFQVRVAVAQANRVNLRNALQAAERNFTLLTALRADTQNIQAEVPVWNDPRSLNELIDFVRVNAPQARTAQLNVVLADIAARRVKAQYLPQVSAQLSRVQTSGGAAVDTNRVAITLSAPLGFSTYYDGQRAASELVRTQESLRFAQDSLATETTRLYLAIISYRDEIRIRAQAVEGAKLSVEANVRSYQGGVKTNIDVISSYQTLADAEVALVNSRLILAEAELRLALFAQNIT